MIWSILKPRIRYAYESLGWLDLEIWRFSCRRQTKPIALPLAHAHGLILFFTIHCTLPFPSILLCCRVTNYLATKVATTQRKILWFNVLLECYILIYTLQHLLITFQSHLRATSVMWLPLCDLIGHVRYSTWGQGSATRLTRTFLDFFVGGTGVRDYATPDTHDHVSQLWDCHYLCPEND